MDNKKHLPEIKQYQAVITWHNTGDSLVFKFSAFNKESAKAIITGNFPEKEDYTILELDEINSIVQIQLIPYCPN
jgi:hypothetical protein